MSLYDDDDYGEDYDDDRGGFHSPARNGVDLANPAIIDCVHMPDGSPRLRIGVGLGVALDFDGPVLPQEYGAAVARVHTQRGMHLIFCTLLEADSLLSLADAGHIEASKADGAWDLRVFDKDTLAPRTLEPLPRSLVPGAPAALWEAVAREWRSAGGLIKGEGAGA